MSFKDYIKTEYRLLSQIDKSLYRDGFSGIESIIALIKYSSQFGRIFLCGNGGSFLTAEHFAEDAMKGMMFNLKKPASITVLGANPGMQMAIANDIGWEDVFSFELQAHDPDCDDLLIGLSVSGESKNVVKAFEFAKTRDMHRIAFTGMNGVGALYKLGQISVKVDSNHFGIVEDVHSACLHYIAYQLMNKNTWRK